MVRVEVVEGGGGRCDRIQTKNVSFGYLGRKKSCSFVIHLPSLRKTVNG